MNDELKRMDLKSLLKQLKRNMRRNCYDYFVFILFYFKRRSNFVVNRN